MHLPFSVALDEFTVEYHPRTRKPKVFRSDITRIEDDVSQPVKISMNQPMRHKGFTLFQSSWGPPGSRSEDRQYTVLAVVRNPSDHWPLGACIVVAIGLTMAFVHKLVIYLQAQKRLAGRGGQP